ncbi:MAG: ribosome hibernation-promoting factor, HPF/YfiA family [Acidimicrobiia bacterium]
MEVRVHGRHLHVDSALQEAAQAKVSHAARMWEGAATADVEFTEEQNPRITSERFRVEITTGGGGRFVRVHAVAESPEAALDLAVGKFERRLSKLKGRLIARSRRTNKELNLRSSDTENQVESPDPAIVRTKQFVLKPMTPEEAVLQIEMLGHSFYFFQNAETDLPSVIYRRRDGAYGLIEPA